MQIQFVPKERCITCGRPVESGTVCFSAPAKIGYGLCCCIDCVERAEAYCAKISDEPINAQGQTISVEGGLDERSYEAMGGTWNEPANVVPSEAG